MGEPAGDRAVRLRLKSGPSPAAARGAVALYRGRGQGALMVDRFPSGDLLIRHGLCGDLVVDGAGTSIVCRPADVPGWLWQRLLVGQGLPLAVLLQGVEVIHASAVTRADRALLLLGGSGAGKTTTALGLVTSGAQLLADDVAAVELVDGVPVVHPGPALVTVTSTALGDMEAALPALEPLGALEGETRARMPVAAAALPVGAVYRLSPRAEGRRVTIRAIRRERAAVLLGATFNAYLRTAERMRRQLDVAAGLATAPMFEVVAPRSLGLASLVGALVDHGTGGST